MPSYDKSRFVGNEEEINEFVCAICQGVLELPLCTPCCRQLYCTECIYSWFERQNTCPNDRANLNPRELTQPPRLVINLISKLKITCDNFEKGCPEIFPKEKLKDHLQNCKFNICDVCKFPLISNHNCSKNFQMQIKELRNEVAGLKQVNTEMNDRNAELQQSKNILDVQIKDLEKSNSEMMVKISTLESLNREIGSTNEYLQNSKTEAENKIEKLEENISELGHTIKELTKSNEESGAKIENYEKVIRQMAEMYSELNGFYNELKTLNASLEKNNGEKDNKIAALENSNDEKNNNIAELKKIANDFISSIDDLKAKITSLEKEKNEKDGAIEALEGSNSEMRVKIKNLETINQEIMSKSIAESQKIFEMDIKITNLEKTNMEMDNIVSALEKINDEVSAHIDTLESHQFYMVPTFALAIEGRQKKTFSGNFKLVKNLNFHFL